MFGLAAYIVLVGGKTPPFICLAHAFRVCHILGDTQCRRFLNSIFLDPQSFGPLIQPVNGRTPIFVFCSNLGLCELCSNLPTIGEISSRLHSFYVQRNKRSLVRNSSRSGRFPCTLLPLQQRLAALQLVLPGGGRLSLPDISITQ